MYIYILFGTIIFLCALNIFLNYNERARMIKKIPGPKMDFIFGNGLPGILSSDGIMALGRKYAMQWKDLYSIWVYPFAVVVIYNPKDIETILSNIKHGDKSIIYSLLKSWLGDGLLLSKGTKWQERRKILTPAFHFSVLKVFFDIIEENSKWLVDKLKQNSGKPIEVPSVISEFTLNTICETAMGTQLNENTTGITKSYRNAIYDIGSIIIQRFVRVFLYPDFIFNLTSLGKNQRKYLKTVHNFTHSVINQRRDYIEKSGINTHSLLSEEDNDSYMKSKRKKIAMLDLLLLAEKDGLIDNMGVQEEVDTFMFEGHDTTASGLTFCFMILANHKDIQDKIRDELFEIFGDSKRPIKMDDLNRMKYLECCIKESVRMYPPVHFISRNLNEPTVLSNYTVPAGTICHISIFDLHRSESLYRNPNKFDPDRFLPENNLNRHPYAYIPFSAGSRNCIGQKFAMMEMKITVAKVLREFDLVPVTRPDDIRYADDIILRCHEPILVNFVKRTSVMANKKYM